MELNQLSIIASMVYPNLEETGVSSAVLVAKFNNPEKTEAIIHIPRMRQTVESTKEKSFMRDSLYTSQSPDLNFVLSPDCDDKSFLTIYTKSAPKEKPQINKKELEKVLGCTIV